MKKNDLTVKVKLELPKKVITTILNKGLSRFEEAKYLLLAHYYQHQYFIVGVKEMNKYLGIKDAKGRDLRINMVHWNIINPIESAKVKRNNKGQFFKKGYDIYQPSIKTDLIEYLIISDDARSLIGTHSGCLLDALNLVAEKANANDIKQYVKQKAEYKSISVLKITDDLKAVLNQELSKKLESKPIFPDDETFAFEAVEEIFEVPNAVVESQHVGIPSEVNNDYKNFIQSKLRSAKVNEGHIEDAIDHIMRDRNFDTLQLSKKINMSFATTQQIVNKINRYWN